MKKIRNLVWAVIALPALSYAQTKARLTSYVNPLMGTTVLTDPALLGYDPPWRTWNGLTGPGATLPHGMVQVVPVTTYGSGSGYEYEVKTIKAIAQTSGNHWGILISQLCHWKEAVLQLMILNRLSVMPQKKYVRVITR
ncbi:hypothetical protein [Mucilaginibacter antarcticus]|uniref:hypothetical protein n=1 Tax=Mucilaginibacter antarcticus TaxID=1855725 RepID=UPI0036372C94